VSGFALARETIALAFFSSIGFSLFRPLSKSLHTAKLFLDVSTQLLPFDDRGWLEGNCQVVEPVT
jgi:hypothetical protein